MEGWSSAAVKLIRNMSDHIIRSDRRRSAVRFPEKDILMLHSEMRFKPKRNKPRLQSVCEGPALPVNLGPPPSSSGLQEQTSASSPLQSHDHTLAWTQQVFMTSDSSSRTAAAAPWRRGVGLTWSVLHILAEGLQLRLPDCRICVEDDRAAQPLCGSAQTLSSQILCVLLPSRSRRSGWRSGWRSAWRSAWRSQESTASERICPVWGLDLCCSDINSYQNIWIHSFCPLVNK